MIARLEDRQRHGNLSTAEERRTLAEIEKAKGSRKARHVLPEHRLQESSLSCFVPTGSCLFMCWVLKPLRAAKALGSYQRAL